MGKPAKAFRSAARRKTGKGATDAPAKTGENPAALIPQAHGGALSHGGIAGNAGGTGRPPSVLRERLRGSFSKRIEVLEEVADGEVMQKAQIPLLAILPHVLCPKCGDKLEPKNPADLFTMTITGKVSASVKDRISAIKLMGDLGLAETPVSIEMVRAKVESQLDVLRSELPPDVFAQIVPKLRDAWLAR